MNFPGMKPEASGSCGVNSRESRAKTAQFNHLASGTEEALLNGAKPTAEAQLWRKEQRKQQVFQFPFIFSNGGPSTPFELCQPIQLPAPTQTTIHQC